MKHSSERAAIAREATRLELARRIAGARQGRRLDRMERLRRTVVAVVAWARKRGHTLKEIAGWIGMKTRTLRHWARLAREGLLRPRPRGRSLARSERACRSGVLYVLELYGPRLGVPTLRRLFPQMARAELDRLVKGYRRAYKRRSPRVMEQLDWTLPGRVWAMDLAEPPEPIEGIYRYLLVVRDLASGRNLVARPLMKKGSAEICSVLEGLFLVHGAPLVLKSDNEGSFRAARTQALLAAHDVLHLLSPPRTPRYNGACESAIRWLKHDLEGLAFRDAHPGCWTLRDLHRALWFGNVTRYPNGERGASAEAIWNTREQITERERSTFFEAVTRHTEEVRREIEDAIGRREEARIARVATRRALVECGYLDVRRRRVTPPISRRKVASNS